MKKIRFAPSVPAEVRAIEQRAAMAILRALHRYAETGKGREKPLSGEFAGLLRLRAGNHRVLFDETKDTITYIALRIGEMLTDEAAPRRAKTAKKGQTHFFGSRCAAHAHCLPF